MHQLSAYLPQDRRLSLAQGAPLPDRTCGSALFADISGFTALAEALVQCYGMRQGAEELQTCLSGVFEVLVNQVEGWDGSVVDFSGDAITCWFDELAPPTASLNAPGRAIGCGLAMQQAMNAFAAVDVPGRPSVKLGVKVAVASGPVRRFVVGNPQIQKIDTLAGQTITRMAAGAMLANRGQVWVDEATLAGCQGNMGWHISGWGEAMGIRFASLVSDVAPNCQPVSTTCLPGAPPVRLSPQMIRPWILSAVWERLESGGGDFLAELHPATSLFLRFTGIDYDSDSACWQLDSFIRQVQEVATQYEGNLIDLTIGDKGSYLLIAFGVPVVHEDDPQRAVRAALALRQSDMPVQIQMGITHGMIWAGAYGSSNRRTYNILGDDVNLAARLMEQATPGQILVSGRVHAAANAFSPNRSEDFVFEECPSVRLKGKHELVPVFALRGVQLRRSIHLQEPTYHLPMFGRHSELQAVSACIEQVLQGRGRVVGICAEAGIGKSRLVAEIIHQVSPRGLIGYGGACQSSGAHVLYQVWKSVWQAFFEIDPQTSRAHLVQMIEGALRVYAPERKEALPLLGPLLDLPLPENDFTNTLDPELRRSALEALLLDCLSVAAEQARSKGQGLLLMLEDMHWIDLASFDLLEMVVRSCVDLPVLILLAYRPAFSMVSQEALARLESLPHFTLLNVSELDENDARLLITAKLAQLFPLQSQAVKSPDLPGPQISALLNRIHSQAQGNPFYIEELLNYLHDQNIDPYRSAAEQALEWPTSLHSLVLSRIHGLTPRHQHVLKAASVIGRLFGFDHLQGYYPALGNAETLKADLDELSRLGITPIAAPEPHLAYLFNHIVVRDVAYETLPRHARAALHEQYAAYLETQAEQTEGQWIDMLAYHYSLSNNVAKKRVYLQKAGRSAAGRFANQEAIVYLSRALELTPPGEEIERYALLLAREQVYDLLGDRQGQQQDLEQLAALPLFASDPACQAEVLMRQANLAFATGDYTTAISASWNVIHLHHPAASSAEALPALVKQEIQAHQMLGSIFNAQGDNPAALQHAQLAIDLSRSQGLRDQEAYSLHIMALACIDLCDQDRARRCSNAALEIYQALGDRLGQARVLSDLGAIHDRLCEYEQVRRYNEQALVIRRETGDRSGEATALLNLGNVCICLGDYPGAQTYYEQSLSLRRQIGDRHGEASSLSNLGILHYNLGRYWQARECMEAALDIARVLQATRLEAVTLINLGMLLNQAGDLASAATINAQALVVTLKYGLADMQAFALVNQGYTLVDQGSFPEAQAGFRQAVDIRRSLAVSALAMEAQAGLALATLAAGDTGAAAALASEVLDYLGQQGPDGMEEPVQVYLACWKVLRSIAPERANDAAAAGARLIQSRAAPMDPATCESFLTQVPANRAIIEAAKNQACI